MIYKSFSINRTPGIEVGKAINPAMTHLDLFP